MQIDIDDNDLKGFNSQAKTELVKASKSFITDLVEESNRIESARSSTSGGPEITSSMVNDAATLIRRGLSQPKKRMGVKILRAVAAILSLVVGLLYDATKLQDSAYMIVFILTVAGAIITVTIATLAE